MKNEYGLSITLFCPTCESDTLKCLDEFENEDTQYECGQCKASFSEKEVLSANAERIDAAVEEMKSEILSDMQTDFKEAFKQ